jgi:hypothetical protein
MAVSRDERYGTSSGTDVLRFTNGSAIAATIASKFIRIVAPFSD